ncbi:radical SAM (seleno)protein TrsS [Desulfocurvus sp. DL9XJH121]
MAEEETLSLCPVCLARVPARRVTLGAETRLMKTCPEHGAFSAPVWRGEPAFSSWVRPKIPSRPREPFTGTERGCPFDCGLCPEHGQHTCTALIEVTWRCNLRCPVCFASAGETPPPDPTKDEIAALLAGVMRASGPCNIQLSGGEPTVREDLPDLVALAKGAGFPFVQVNTNGLRMAREPGYAEALARAGLDSAFLQFDGVTDGPYRSLRGAPLLQEKLLAVERLAEAGVGVVLVPTVAPDVNDFELGDILRLAVSLSPGVRGVHYQPVSYFGRYPEAPADAARITLPEVMAALEAQTDGLVRRGDFTPPGCEHALCSFSANYLVAEDGSLTRLSQGGEGCGCRPAPAAEGADRSKAFTARQWAAPAGPALPMAEPADDLDRFLARARTHRLSVSGMAFQDAWTVDLARVQGCCIHVAAPDGRMVPFCAYNLTAMDGRALHRRTADARTAS